MISLSHVLAFMCSSNNHFIDALNRISQTESHLDYETTNAVRMNYDMQASPSDDILLPGTCSCLEVSNTG